MQIEVYAHDDEVAASAARWLAAEARAAVAERGRFLCAVSGGKTPWQMLRALASEDIPWRDVHLFQIDERVAPEGHPDRNLTHLRDSLAAQTSLPIANIHPMPVTADDLTAAAALYAAELAQWGGEPARLDVAHLGLGADGHTASLVPDDPVLAVLDRDVAITSEYQGRIRMTLTYPLLNRSRKILWLATGPSKREMLSRLLAGDTTIPAGRIAAEQALLMTDQQL